MVITVWIDSWQMQCCGEPFHLGSEVGWTLGTAHAERLAEILGSGRPMDAAEEHHGGVPEDTEPTQGTVTGIAGRPLPIRVGLWQELGNVLPGQGSGVLTEIESADGRTADRGDERFVGYLVQLDCEPIDRAQVRRTA